MKLLRFLDGSAVTPTFREAVQRFAASGQTSAVLTYPLNIPGVKIERALTKLLEEYPDLPIESVSIDGHSGCEFFRGTMEVRTSHQLVQILFEWNCRWKADQLGWVDYFGFPDQPRAAREFGHDCFRTWRQEGVEELAEA